jgi:hypothetical protein
MFLHDRIDPNDRFRERRRQAQRRRRIRRAIAVLLVAGIVAAIAGGATYFSSRGSSSATPAQAASLAVRPKAAKSPFRTPAPTEIRGIHVTEGLASIPGKLDEYLGLTKQGLNTIELDVKDENGYVGFVSAATPALARATGAARPYYNAKDFIARAHGAGVYVIGRVVVFEDSTLTAARPELGIQSKWGGLWKTSSGLGWANVYDPRVWKYNVDVGIAAAKAGFDEIQFDYVRFPTDGDTSAMVFPHKRAEPRSTTIDRFFSYAVARLHPLHVRVSADVFGLSASRDLGIGQSPRRIGNVLDAIYPMVYPSHYNPGEYNLLEPEAFPYATVIHSLRDFNKRTRGEKVRIVPWLQDFTIKYSYGLEQVGEQIDAARTMRAKGFLLWNPSGEYTSDALAHRSPSP